ncbi:type II secretion system protein GspM [Methylovulum psychrotolerans]|jgi:general secretion pathway protein M|uniref:General secretion pathway protein GspM n=1 Tax=Methylovulum psychrotolerans TaxID=1704499 RepID=A0A1Z4BVC0_9GAMM|nr:type II secretion system protein GspM [Methylovulum psychrotolerans]ASF45193.1 general secretion pathway protein GspM [Methylovulum psychrotolerans]POZ53518.1 general secretion pathway protein GspM [Methylovulum psychrotolerans]
MKILKQPIINNINKDRWLAVGLLAGVVLVVGSLVLIPLVGQSLDLHDKKEGLLFKLEQYQRILAKKDAVIASMESLKVQHDEQGYFNSQQTDALASAEMQDFIKKSIVDAGGQLSSTQAIPVSLKGGFSRITVRVRMTGNSEVLRAVLYKIETSTPLIVVDQIDIRPMRGRRSMTSHKIEPSNDLNVNFQAVSFMRKKPE